MAKGTLKIKIIGDDSDFKGKLSGVIGSVGKLGVAFAGAAIVGGLTAGAKAGIDFNSAIEQTTVSLSTMLGSQEKANDLIGEMTAFAAKTPYEFPELADSTKKLLAFGVAQENIIPTMTMLGDISAGLGINVSELAELYGKAKVQGRLFAEDVNQLTGRGIPVIQEFAKQFGVSESEVRGLVEAGKIGFPELQTALESLTGESGKFGGLMAAQSQTFAGQWSTLKDTINQTMGQAMKPIFDWLTGTALPAAIELLGKFSAGFAEGGFLGGLKAMFDGLGESVGGFMSTLQGAFQAIAPVVQEVWAFIVSIVSQAWAVIQPIVAAIADWIRAHWDEISAVTSSIWETVKAVISTALELIKKVVGLALAAIKAFWDAHGDEVMAVVTFIWNTVRTVVETVMGAIREVMGAIMDAINGDWSAAWEHLKAAGVTIWEGIKSLAIGVFNGLKGALSAIWDSIKGAFEGLWDGCKGAWDSAAEWIGNIPDKIKGFFSGAATWLKDIGRSIMDGLLSGIKDAWNKVAGFLSSVGAKIKSYKGPIEKDRRLLIPEGRAIMSGLAEGLKGGFPEVALALKGLTASIPGQARSAASGYGSQVTTNNNQRAITINVAGSSGLDVGRQIAAVLAGI